MLSEEMLDEGRFEGPEKTLEVCFAPGVGGGCRALEREALDAILAEARCTILSRVSNDHLDAYVLSESSLFVYKYKWVIKTCGRTTLLRCLRKLLTYTKGLAMRLEWVGYSRKNFVFPAEQPSPHTSFHEELAYLKAHRDDSRNNTNEPFDGSGYVLGPVTGDHWFVYVADQCERPSETATERTINVMMFDLADEAREAFYLRPGERDDDAATARAMTRRSHLADLVGDHGLVDARAFAPCGYSMNALVYGSYTTVHVTPEPSCSYASFETNTPLTSYAALLKNVLSVFKPKKVVVTLFADAAGLQQHPHAATVDALPAFDVPKLGRYARADFSSLCVETDCVCMMANYILDDPKPTTRHLDHLDDKPNHRRRRGLAPAEVLRPKPAVGLAHFATPTPPQIHVGSLP